MNTKALVLTLLSLPLIASGLDADPPRNPFLANSPWPMSHRNTYNQASSPLAGPAAATATDAEPQTTSASPRFLTQCPVPITLVYGEKNAKGHFSIWGNCKEKVFKIDSNGGAWTSSVSVFKGDSPARHISGAYTLVDSDNVYFMPYGHYLLGYAEKEKGEPSSAIELVKSFEIPETQLITDSEDIVGLNLTYDGWLAAITRYNLLVLINRATGDSVTLRLSNSKDEEVSNSLAVDEDGGIYALSDRALYRVQWDAKSHTLSQTWSAPYPKTTAAMPGRLGVGSGTTPTLMGTGSDDKLVVIADGQEKMQLLAFWRNSIPKNVKPLSGFDPQVAGAIGIDFGYPGITRSITEQSVLVSGSGAVVVNNDYGNRKTGHLYNLVTILNSNKKGIAPYGIQKFDWDNSLHQWKEAWHSPALSAPNGIPCMSRSTGLIYYVGQFEENWTFEAVNWLTGDLAFRKILGKDRTYNSFYAATEIGYDGALLSGSYGGAMLLK